MQRALTVFVVAIFVFSSFLASAQQSFPGIVVPQSQGGVSTDSAPNCGEILNAAIQAQQTLDRDRRNPSPSTNSNHATRTEIGNSDSVYLQNDLEFLEQALVNLNQCNGTAHEENVMEGTPNDCRGEELLKFQMSHHGDEEREIPIWRLPGSTAFFYGAGMTIDADGAPNAYHPDNTGLDDLANAGAPGNWEGLAKNDDGEPMLQGVNDPFPGYYVSQTALADRTKPMNDPKRYVDASKIPYIVLPAAMARQIGARTGDFSVVLNQRNGKSSYAIFADVGPSDRIGEGSVALAENLGIRSNARNGGTRGGIVYLVFPGSGDGRPRTMDEINAESEKLLQAWGGISQLTACTVQEPANVVEGGWHTN